MTDDLTPDPAAMQRMAEMDQMAASLRGIAESVVLLRKTLLDGGFTPENADAMAMRAWAMFFPTQHPLGFLFGGGAPS